jgi:hypothetical protein
MLLRAVTGIGPSKTGPLAQGRAVHHPIHHFPINGSYTIVIDGDLLNVSSP